MRLKKRWGMLGKLRGDNVGKYTVVTSLVQGTEELGSKMLQNGEARALDPA